MKTINLIGCGRVGKVLAQRWHALHTLQIQDVMTTSLPSAQAAVQWIGAGHAVAHLQAMRSADLWLIAVPDRNIADIAASLAETWNHHQAAAQNSVAAAAPMSAFHCSGALASSELSPLSALGWQIASAHCILSFAKPELALQQINGTPCALEGDALILETLHRLYSAIGLKPFALTAEHKMLYHAAAVFATNFLPVLQNTAERLWQSAGMPAEHIAHLRASLLQNSVDNIVRLGPQAALTGPASRGDLELVQHQGQAVGEWDKAAGRAYLALSEMAKRLAQSDPTQ